MRRITMPKEFYIPKGSTKVEFSGGEAYQGEFQNALGETRFRQTIFLGKQSKPISHYHYKTVEARQAALNAQIENTKGDAERKAQRRAERKPSNAGVAVGDIFVSSGGYDQTNVEALQVVKLVGKSSVEVREIGFAEDKAEWQGPMCNHVRPVKDNFLDVATDKFSENRAAYARGKGGLRQVIGGRIRGTWGSGGKWDGKSSMYQSWYH